MWGGTSARGHRPAKTAVQGSEQTENVLGPIDEAEAVGRGASVEHAIVERETMEVGLWKKDCAALV